MVSITKIHAIEILDSRGNPTLMTKVVLSNGAIGTAMVPSGASTGTNEAVELRDGGKRYGGKGVTRAVKNVNTIIAEAMVSVNPLSQAAVDKALLDIDPSKGKGKMGANAILSVSMATAVAAASYLKMELFEYLRTKVIGKPVKYLQPIPMSNVINGGAHAGNDLAIQEFMILPVGPKSFPEGLRCISEVYQTLGKMMIKKHGRMAKHIGDEGGYCGYRLKSTTDAFDAIIGAVEEVGYRPKKDVVLGIDAAATSFFEEGKYAIDGQHLDPSELIEFYLDLEKTYPLSVVEDPFEEAAFEDFSAFTKRTKTQVVADDITVSNPEIVKRAIEERAGNALLLKVNQIGTVTEAIESAKIANEAGWAVVVSHRSGETGDTFISDLSVALSNGQIKTGAPARSDRVEKYNRLLEIYDILGGECGYPSSEYKIAWRKY